MPLIYFSLYIYSISLSPLPSSFFHIPLLSSIIFTTMTISAWSFPIFSFGLSAFNILLVYIALNNLSTLFVSSTPSSLLALYLLSSFCTLFSLYSLYPLYSLSFQFYFLLLYFPQVYTLHTQYSYLLLNLFCTLCLFFTPLTSFLSTLLFLSLLPLKLSCLFSLKLLSCLFYLFHTFY